MNLLPPSQKLPQPKKIWAIEKCYKCSLIGTCLTRIELRKLAKEKVFAVEPGYNDYQLHVAFIQFSDQSDAKGHALHKYLSKKFHSRAKHYLQAESDQAIKELWDKDVAEGLLDTAWWAVLTHPSASVEFVGRLYGTIHMLSHDSLNNLHKERCQIDRLRSKASMLEEILGSERQYYRQEKRRLKKEMSELHQTIVGQAGLERENRTLREETATLKNHILQLTVDKDLEPYQQEISDLRQTNNTLCGRIDELTGELASMKEQVTCTINQFAEMERLCSRLEQHEAEQAREIATLENLLMLHIAKEASCAQCADQNTEKCPGENLCGKTVLYVGGLNNMIPHYRQLVEQCGGRFLHHDGGKEASRSLLPKMLTNADAVLCPVDCVSHDACNCVKKMCKRYQKPFVMMRSAGLSSLAKGLSDIMQ